MQGQAVAKELFKKHDIESSCEGSGWREAISNIMRLPAYRTGRLRPISQIRAGARKDGNYFV